MKRILLLMHEGIGSTIFQSQIAMHASEMKDHGYEIDVWAFETTIKSFKKSQQNLANVTRTFSCQVRLFRGLYVFVPFSALINAALLWWHFRRTDKHFDLIHARTDYSAAVYSYIAALIRVPMLWDCRGDTLDEMNNVLSRKKDIPQIAKSMILSAIRRQEVRAGAGCVAASFVSSGLLARKAKAISTKPRFVIPCAVSSRTFYVSEALRKQYRTQLGYVADDIVLVYSGSMSAYQGFEKYTQFVRRILDSGDSRIKLLVVTPETENARDAIAKTLPEQTYKIVSGTYLEMNGFLNAADCGALLRDTSSMNDVSSPTKFGEYCLAGLPVILDGNVRQALEAALALGNYESYEDVWNGKRLGKRSEKERAQISLKSQPLFSRKYINAEYAAMYRSLIRDSMYITEPLPSVDPDRQQVRSNTPC